MNPVFTIEATVLLEAVNLLGILCRYGRSYETDLVSHTIPCTERVPLSGSGCNSTLVNTLTAWTWWLE